jgi:hypothetical protein
MWLIGLLAAGGVLLIFGIAYFLMGSHGSSSKDTAKQQTTNPLEKYVEVTGVRIVSDTNGQAAKFLLVNHSGVEMTDLTANVTLRAGTSRSDDDIVGTFTVHADSVKPNESKELTVPLKTEKQAFEMPDWRNITPDVQVMSQQQ